MFDNHFEIFLANTPESKKIHYSIRYQVYCEEMGFEDKNRFPMEQEIDDYDQDAIHFIVRHKVSKHWVGAMRLIVKKDRPLPIELNANMNQQPTGILPGTSVELSRLCVIKELRRVNQDLESTNTNISDCHDSVTDVAKLLKNQQKISRKIVFGLIQAASEYCYYHQISNWYFLTTSALAKILHKGGLNLALIGDVCSHKGERYPYKMDVEDTFFNKAWGFDFKRGYQVFQMTEEYVSNRKAA